MRENKLKIIVIIMITIFEVILLIKTASAENLKKIIIGKWNIVGTVETIEFFDDGTIIMKADNMEVVGNYKFLDETRIRIDLTGMGGMVGSQVANILYHKERITLDKLFDKKLELAKMTESRQLFIDGVVLYKKEKYKEAAVLFEKAEKKGELDAQGLLGDIYYKGMGVVKNLEKSYEWHHKAADRGVAYSQRMVGYFYSKGYGTDKDIEKAILWYKKAADQGDWFSMNGLGWIYATSENPEYRNGEKALEYAQKAYLIEKNKWFVLSTLAAAYARSGQFEKAVDNYEKAIYLLNRDYNLSNEERRKKFNEANVILSLYKNNTAYDQSYDIDKAIAEKIAEKNKIEVEKKQAREAAEQRKKEKSMRKD